MTSGKYFNKGVKALDSPDIGHVVRETPDKIVIFGGKHERYDIPISEIQQVGANVLIDLWKFLSKVKRTENTIIISCMLIDWQARIKQL